MLTASEIFGFAARKWTDLLLAEAKQELVFPLYVRFGRPATTGDFEEIRRAAAALEKQAKGWRVEWEDLRTRKWGAQRWPVRVVFESIEDVALTLGRTPELNQVRRALREARQILPALEPWLCKNAHRIPELVSDWADLLAVCAYFEANPRPNCYARQIPAAPDTKFVEQREAILGEWLDVILGEHANRTAVSFAERFHLRNESPQVRFRFLDDELRVRNGWPVDDCTVSLSAFAALTWRIPRVLIVENRTVFLCAPQIANAIVIWGAGDRATLLRSCGWLRHADVVYWGDCDEAGYGILSNLRDGLPHIRSALMDVQAWTRWSQLAVPGKRDKGAVNTNLTAKERAALDAVISGPWMLEQERIPPREAESVLITTFEERRSLEAVELGALMTEPIRLVTGSSH